MLLASSCTTPCTMIYISVSDEVWESRCSTGQRAGEFRIKRSMMSVAYLSDRCNAARNWLGQDADAIPVDRSRATVPGNSLGRPVVHSFSSEPTRSLKPRKYSLYTSFVIRQRIINKCVKVPATQSHTFICSLWHLLMKKPFNCVYLRLSVANFINSTRAITLMDSANEK